MNSSKSPSYTQPTSSGVGVDLYNLTGNSPLDPMSTRNKELFKRKKEMNSIEKAKKAVAFARQQFKIAQQKWDLDDEETASPKEGLSSQLMMSLEDMSPTEIIELLKMLPEEHEENEQDEEDRKQDEFLEYDQARLQQIMGDEPEGEVIDLQDDEWKEVAMPKPYISAADKIHLIRMAYKMKVAIDWDKLTKDPKFMERMKQRMEQAQEEQKAPSKSEPGFKPKKKREDMTLEEVAEEDEKQLKRDMEKAKVQQGKLHLSEENAAIIQKMVDFILAAPIESKSYDKQKQIVQSILSGYKSRDTFTPGWKRDLPDGTSVYVLTTPQLSLISAIYQNAKDELAKPKEEKPFGKIKTEGPTTDEKMNKWKALMQKQMEQRNKKLFKDKGLEYPKKDDEDILDLDE